MRNKAPPRKRGRPVPGASAEEPPSEGEAPPQQQRPPGRKRARVTEPAAIDSAASACADADLLGLADLLLVAPAEGGAPSPGGGGGAERVGPTVEARFSLARDRPDTLVVTWSSPAGGPQAPVSIAAPSEAAAAALLQLLHARRLGASLQRLAWPSCSLDGGGGGGSGGGAPQLAAHVEVFGSERIPEAALAGFGDAVAVPAWRRGSAGSETRLRVGRRDSASQGGGQERQQGHAATEAGGSGSGGDGDGGDGGAGVAAAEEEDAEAEEGALDPGAALRPSRLVSFLAGALAPKLLHTHGGGRGEGGSSLLERRSAERADSPPPEGMQLWRLRIGLTRSAFEQAATAAQDPARRPWQQALLAVAAWLAPHWALGPPGSGADAAEDGDGGGGGGAADSAGSARAAGGAAARRQSASASASGPGARPSAAGAAAAGQPAEFDASALYSWAKPSGLEPALPDSEAPPALLPRLRPYQARAVWWMLQRERAPRHPAGLVAGADSGSDSDSGDSGREDGGGGELHPLWRRVHALPGGFARSFYLNPFSGLVSGRRFTAPPPVRGGIAADEMGLGKTVELLALILVNRFEGGGQEGQQQQQQQQQRQQQQRQQQQRQPKGQQQGSAESSEVEEEDEQTGRGAGAAANSSGGAGGCARCGGPVDPRASAPVLTQQHIQRQRQQQAALRRGAPRRRTEAPRDSPPRAGPARRQSQRQLAVSHRGRGEAGTRRSARGGKRRRGQDSDLSWNGGSSSDGAASEEEDRAPGSESGSGSDWGAGRRRAASRRGRGGGGGARGAATAGAGARARSSAARSATPAGRGGSTPAAGPSLCGACLRRAALETVDSQCGATLVIVPPSILPQWWSELHRHARAGSVRIAVYAGQPQPGTTTSAAAMCAPAAAAAAPGAFAAALVAHGGSSGGGLVAASARAGQRGAGGDGAGPAAPDATAPPPPAEGVVTAAELAGCDVVLTTYDVLRRELAMQPDDEEPQRSLRRPKRYEVVPTPLTRLRWWRVVLDEAQAVGSSTAKAAEMAAKLSAENRWAVTGTPISRGLEDLYGLLNFLGAAPWDDRRWWGAALQGPAERGDPAGAARLAALLRPSGGGLMWRSAKTDPGVASDMGLPPLLQHTTRLRLSAVERHWYQRAHAECAANARRALPERALALASAEDAARRASGAGGSAAPPAPDPLLDRPLTHSEQKKLLLPLLRLRQACCHPQVGAGGLRGGGGGGPSGGAPSAPLSMAEILGVLTGKARTEAEEAQRAVVHALNGLAGLMLIEGKDKDAVELYRAALATSEENKAEVRTDPLQLLHTLSNLEGTLAAVVRKAAAAAARGAPAPPPVPRTLRDSSLRQQADAIRDAYLAPRVADLAAQRAAYAKAREAAAGGAKAGKGGAGRRPAGRARGGARGGGGGGASASVAEFARALVDDGAGGEGPGGADEPSSPGVEVAAAAAPAPGDAAVGGARDGWFVPAIDALEACGRGEEVSEAVRSALMEREQYDRAGAQNATTLARRFSTLGGLKLLLSAELDAIAATGGAVVTLLEDLDAACDSPSRDLVERASTCARCRAELGTARGRACDHCKLDDRALAWELRLFTLTTRAIALGAAVSAEAAARAAQAQTLRRIGRGGLHEEGAGEGGTAALDAGGRRGDNSVAETQVFHHPSEAERVLRLLLQQLQRHVGRSHPELVAAGQAHLERLEGQRRLFLAARALALAQRMLLYAHDELAMATMRMRLRLPGESVAPHEAVYKLHEAELVPRNHELSGDRLLAEEELRRKLGTLRYLRQLRLARERSEARAAAAAAAAAAEGGGEAPTGAPAPAAAPAPEPCPCPVCHEEIGAACAVLPCAHSVCCGCAEALVARLPPGLGWQQRRVGCPTCRARAHVADIAYVDEGGSGTGGRGAVTTTAYAADAVDAARNRGSEAAAAVAAPAGAGGDAVAPAGAGAGDGAAPPGGWWAAESSVRVAGSYGSKVEAVVRRVLCVLRADPSARVLVFTAWSDLADILAHALARNGVALAQARGRQGFVRAVEEFKAGAAEEGTPEEGAPEAGGVAADGSSGGGAAGGDPATPGMGQQPELEAQQKEREEQQRGQQQPGPSARLAAAQLAPRPAAPRVLLLLTSQGGRGLNLTEACHVVMVEPLQDPALEVQAVGRIHRFGQARPSHVHRFLVEHSIEENVAALAAQRAAAMDMSAAAPTRGGAAGEAALTVRNVAALLRADWATTGGVGGLEGPAGGAGGGGLLTG
ncbi:hypothetical protein Rsub_12416 [Raphidocelis subcapitata]|uniref:RING-type domain-containing protein n=1 Tax=Raphidocelis subcapitata TaxID=307507 RepID=A0A2V0PIS0_9CHLO|nr:hypothetical protein Rsub_12416 [Raphidocelis subcapitata]|eukprot:GBF99704.1 hypothetical protein Rsub_12416 [Raphidocelis subcapitata]